ncbi:MAG TPA: hypothetical protein PLZ84_00285 [Clostridia bacterium]|nr:hypothetical protein [Clostridia bacterium]
MAGQTSLFTPLSGKDITKAIKKNTFPYPILTSVGEASSRGQSDFFASRFDDAQMRIVHIRISFNNVFRRTFHAKLIPCADGTIITGRFKMGLFAKVFSISTYVCLFISYSAYIFTLISKKALPELKPTLILVILTLAVSAMIFGGLAISRKDEDAVLTFLANELGAKPCTVKSKI